MRASAHNATATHTNTHVCVFVLYVSGDYGGISRTET